METNSKVSSQQFQIDPMMRIGYVSLNVSDLQRSIDFYKSVLGFKVSGKVSSGNALLSVEGDNSSSSLIELLQVEKKEGGKHGPTFMNEKVNSSPPQRAGLYHFAILLPERKYLADMLSNLADKKDNVHFDGLADHLVSEAIYIRDPDFNGVEIYHDRPRSEWKWSKRNELQMATLPLNRTDLLKESTEEGWKGMPAKTTIGHVHLHVRNLARAMEFYHDTLGLGLTTTYPGAYFFAAGEYHHHIATNRWLGNGIKEASPEDVGLNHFSIELSSKEEFEKTIRHLPDSHKKVAESGMQTSFGSLFIHDTDGIKIKLQNKK